MRIFELILTGLLAAAGIWGLAGGASCRMLFSVFLGLDLAALLLHLKFEGAHWQMAPSYLGLLALAIGVLRGTSQGQFSNVPSITLIVLAALTAIVSAIFPMFRLPRPTGPLAIGTRVAHLVDTDRADSASQSGKREFMIQIWYPAEASKQPLASYRRRRETTLLSSYQAVLPVHSRWNVPLARQNGPFPVLLFNPAWNGRRTQNTYLVEDLASHGFVVVGIDHTYNSEPVAFPDGRVVFAAPVKEMDFSSNSLETIDAAANKELATQTADDIFVLDHIEGMSQDPTSDFYRRIDASNVGALGHSFGGAVAAQLCSQDSRVRAAVDIDGSLFGPVALNGLKKPFMVITEGIWVAPHQYLSLLNHTQLIERALDARARAMMEKSGAYEVTLPGATHFSFTDKALFSPIAALSTNGDIPARREFAIVRAYVLAFFNQTLLGERSSLLDSRVSPFQEVWIGAMPNGSSRRFKGDKRIDRKSHREKD